MKKFQCIAFVVGLIVLTVAESHAMVVCARDDGTGQPREKSKLTLKSVCVVGKEVEVGIAYDPATRKLGLRSADVTGDLTVRGGSITVTNGSLSVLSRICSSFDTSSCYVGARFEDVGLTIIDHQTGLEWEKKDGAGGGADNANPHDVDNVYTWSSTGQDPDGTAFTDFLSNLNSTGFAGQHDWLLPTVHELQTILRGVYPCLTVPFVDPIFVPTQSIFYWSSSTVQNSPTSAWIVDFYVGETNSGPKMNSLYVRVVRSGP